MRVLIAIHLLALSSLFMVCAGETAEEWLERAADPALSRRERDFAVRQIAMLADSSASILRTALREGKPEDAIRRRIAARLLGDLALPATEAPLLEAAFGMDPLLADAASVALAEIYSRMGDNELLLLLNRGGREAGTVPGGLEENEGDDWLVLSLASNRAKGRFRAIVMRGVALKFGNGGRIPDWLARRIFDCLTDADRELRLLAARAAGLAGGETAGERLAAFLYVETDPFVLVEALRSLARLRLPLYKEAIERHTAHADPLVAIEALAALDAMGYGDAMFPSRPGARSIALFVSHPSTPVRRRAIELLGGSRNPVALEYLEAALFDRVGANRAAAVRALAGLGVAGTAGVLSPLLRDGWPEVRAEAAIALAAQGVMGVAARMMDDLAGESLPFRRAAAVSLARIGDARAVPILLETLGDPDVELACLAAEALGGLAGREFGARLYDRMTKAANPVLVDAIRSALARICRDDPGSSPETWRSWAGRNGLENQGDGK
ncbi:MAG: HEAT repeat domain-containing protein [Planctomycetota bacterium]|jgi:HEAT repeat protein|nr:HEAT repeat domain-containing protein [Planctomycetota bacterium]